MGLSRAPALDPLATLGADAQKCHPGIFVEQGPDYLHNTAKKEKTNLSVGLFFFGGESGIRTHGTLTSSPVFKTGAFNRSAISPSTNLLVGT